MPKKVPDYSNSCIYKLVHKEDFDNENIYIGSTTNFIKRKYKHKTVCNNEGCKYYNFKLYQYIRENGGWNSWCMIQIEPYTCSSKKELETQERYWIEKLKPKLNNNIPTRTTVEYRIDNKDKIAEIRKEYYYDNKNKINEIKKQYYIDNKNKINERKKQYYIDNKDKIAEIHKEYYYDNRDKLLEKHKQYHIDNKNKINERQKQYYIDNKDKNKQYYIDNKNKINERKKQKVICDNCGCEIGKSVLQRHKKSQKCINFNSK